MMSATPIFDLEKPLPKAKSKWGVYLIGIPVMVLTFFGPLNAELFWDNAPELNGLLLFPGLWLAILMHELGHLIAGRLAGVPTGAFSVGGIALARSGSRWIVRFDARWLLGGFVMPAPPTREFRPGAFAFLVAGGPISSLLFATACWFIYARFGDGGAQWIGSMFWTSTMGLVGAIIPYKGMGLRSDTARLWQLWRNPEEGRRWIAVVNLGADEMKGVRPRDWDAKLVQHVLEAKPSADSYANVHFLASYRSLDQGDEAGAAAHLETAIFAASRQGNKRLMKLTFQLAAGLGASFRNNPAQARLWQERAQKVQRGKLEAAEGIEADIAIAQGRYSDALVHIAKRRVEIEKKRLDSGIARFAKARLAEREERCRAALSAQSPEISVSQSAVPQSTPRAVGAFDADAIVDR